jgi:hypothetical protein
MENVEPNVIPLFVAGMVTAGFLASGIFFAKFWRVTKIRLFLAFSIAFLLLAINQVIEQSTKGSGQTPTGQSSFLLQLSHSGILPLIAYATVAVGIARNRVAAERTIWQRITSSLPYLRR